MNRTRLTLLEWEPPWEKHAVLRGCDSGAVVGMRTEIYKTPGLRSETIPKPWTVAISSQVADTIHRLSTMAEVVSSFCIIYYLLSRKCKYYRRVSTSINHHGSNFSWQYVVSTWESPLWKWWVQFFFLILFCRIISSLSAFQLFLKVTYYFKYLIRFNVNFYFI